MIDKFFKWFKKKVPEYFQFFFAITIVLVFPLSLPPVLGYDYASLSLRLAILFQNLAVCYCIIAAVLLPVDFLYNLVTSNLSEKPKHYYVVWAICIILSLPYGIGKLGYNSTNIGSVFEISDYTENYVTYISFESPGNSERKVYIQPAVIHREGRMPYYSIEKIQMRDGSCLFFDSEYSFFPNIEKCVTAFGGTDCYVTLTDLKYPYAVLDNK